ncbi:VanW family protein [Kroppenstedtia pulmonis]|uniref:VanW family protein n=2 Tax=Kroppenstedtia pulmonis TaxID=1380685 RepID=A0A7D4CI85_9BACL|nr:VanW family protein [Kroppenstedtia pulmonis]
MAKLGSPIQPEKKGILMDMKKMEENLADLPGRVNKPQEIPMVPDEPKVTTGDLKRVNGKQIGQYTTYFNAGNVNRTTNLRLSSNAINNVVLNPGETFSFNQTVGQRTPERGYKPATIIVQGEYSEGIGGGICQTSSTLYNSVDAAGLAITKRFSHSREVTYVPAGRDATVAWNGPDFGFRNNLSKPILIKTVMENGKLTVQVYSTPDAWHQSKDVQSAPTEVEDMTKDPDPENPSEELDQD